MESVPSSKEYCLEHLVYYLFTLVVKALPIALNILSHWKGMWSGRRGEGRGEEREKGEEERERGEKRGGGGEVRDREGEMEGGRRRENDYIIIPHQSLTESGASQRNT